MSTHNAPRIAHWRTARDRNGRELDLHPWAPGGATALETATIRHCAGCTACGEAVEVVVHAGGQSHPDVLLAVE